MCIFVYLLLFVYLFLFIYVCICLFVYLCVYLFIVLFAHFRVHLAALIMHDMALHGAHLEHQNPVYTSHNNTH